MIVCMTGTTSMKKSVDRCRRMWANSLTMMAVKPSVVRPTASWTACGRCQRPASVGWLGRRRAPRGRWSGGAVRSWSVRPELRVATGLPRPREFRFPGQRHEDIFERGSNGADLGLAPALPNSFHKCFGRTGVGNHQVNRLAEQRRIVDLFEVPEFGQVGRRVRHADFVAAGSFRCDGGQLLEFSRLAADEQFGHVDVADVGTAFRFVHVMRGDQECDTLGRQLEQQDPTVGDVPPGSMPAVGSSRNSISGSWISEQASASRCFQPPDNVPAS